MNKTSFFFFRLPIALSLLGHGLVRLPKLQTFSQWMVSSMEQSVLPSQLIAGFGYLLPFIEFILGALLLIGFKTKWSIYASLSLMSMLILGSSSVENWGAISAQLLHAIYLGALLWYVENKTVDTNK